MAPLEPPLARDMPAALHDRVIHGNHSLGATLTILRNV